jgi:hypothetical protein
MRRGRAIVPGDFSASAGAVNPDIFFTSPARRETMPQQPHSELQESKDGAPMKRNARVALASAATLLGLLACGTAAAHATRSPTREPLRLETPGVVECDGFQDNFVDFLSGTQTTFYGQDGEPVQLVIHAEHTSNDVNSATGFTVHEHGHLTLRIDLITGTVTITGNQEIVNLPHQGVLLQDTGRVIFGAEGALLFFAGGRRHSELFQGEEIFCDILA